MLITQKPSNGIFKNQKKKSCLLQAHSSVRVEISKAQTWKNSPFAVAVEWEPRMRRFQLQQWRPALEYVGYAGYI